jgi:hypothetical protein
MTSLLFDAMHWSGFPWITMEFEAPRYTVPKAPKVEAMLLKIWLTNMTSLKVSYDTISSAYVLKLYNFSLRCDHPVWMPALDRYIHSKYKVSNTWFDQLFYRWSSRNRQRNHVDSSTSFADNDIEIIDHYTTDTKCVYPKCGSRPSKYTIDYEAEILAKTWSSHVCPKLPEVFMGTLFDNVSDKEPLVRLSIFESYCNLGLIY